MRWIYERLHTKWDVRKDNDNDNTEDDDDDDDESDIVDKFNK